MGSLLTILLRTVGEFVLRLIVRGGATPQLAIGASIGGAGVVGLAHEHEGEDAGLAV